MQAWVDACVKHRNMAEVARYVTRVPREAKVKCLVKVRQFREAAEAALEARSEEDFEYVLSRLGLADRQVAEQVRAMRGQLGARR